MFATALLLMLMAGPELETREFRVSVDGRQAGSYKMTIARHPDGTVCQTGQCDVTVQVFLKKYVYSYRGTETWKDGQLMKLESSTNDDGKRYNLRVQLDGVALRAIANNQAISIPATSWTTSHWHMPVDRRQGDITRIDNDNGRVLPGRISRVGQEQQTVAGQSIMTNRYRVTGTAPVDLWFDGADRLVRQESIEDGHRMVIELLKITR